MMVKLGSGHNWMEWTSVLFALLSVIFIFVHLFYSLLFASIGAIIASIGMFLYTLNPYRRAFSKTLWYALLISSIPVIVIFFKIFRF